MLGAADARDDISFDFGWKHRTFTALNLAIYLSHFVAILVVSFLFTFNKHKHLSGLGFLSLTGTGLNATAAPDAQPPVHPDPGLSPPEAGVKYVGYQII